MDPSMLPDLQTLSQGRIACLQVAVQSLGGQFELTSAWRPQQYQDHFVEILDKWQELQQNVDPDCDALRAQVAEEKARHGIGKVVGKTSRHTDGKAIDVKPDKQPPCTNCFNLNAPPGLTREAIDVAAGRCGLARLSGPSLPNDPGHFSTDGR
jgi:hypothetical protein